MMFSYQSGGPIAMITGWAYKWAGAVVIRGGGRGYKRDFMVCNKINVFSSLGNFSQGN